MSFEKPSSGAPEQKRTPLLKVLAPAALAFFAGQQLDRVATPNAEKFIVTEAGEKLDLSERLAEEISNEMVGVYKYAAGESGHAIKKGLYQTPTGRPVFILPGQNDSISILRLNGNGDGRVLNTNHYYFFTKEQGEKDKRES
jgi:hypothetical protein